MLLVFGWKVRSRVVGNGLFHCTRCRVDRHYELRELRRWFTLFFIPVIPLKKVGLFVRCTHCDAHFDERVLAVPTSDVLATQLSIALRAAAVAGATVAGPPGNDALQAAADVVVEHVDHRYVAEDLIEDLAVLGDRPLDELIEPVVDHIQPQGRERVLRVALACAACVGPLDHRARALAERLGQLLDLPSAHVRGVLEEEIERVQRGQA